MASEGIFCFIICFGSTPVPVVKAPIDTLCKTYEKQVISNEDLDAIKGLPKGLRNRIQGNDLGYLCRCTNWKDAACGKKP